jgi:hypothetical protein
MQLATRTHHWRRARIAAFLVQMTVATEHLINLNNILAGTESLLEKNGFKKAKYDNVHIVFLVPPVVYQIQSTFEVPKKMLNAQ